MVWIGVIGAIVMISFLFIIIKTSINVAGTHKKTVENKKREIKEQKEHVQQKIADIFIRENFKRSNNKFFIFNDYDSMIALDEDNRKVAFISSKGIVYKIVNYKDILESHVVEDGISITKTSRGGQIGGALLGGFIAGGVGAIIGGLSSEKRTSDKVKKIELKIIVNDTDKPVQTITFLKGENDKMFNKDTHEYKYAISQAEHWQSLMSVIIKQADEEEKQSKKGIKESNNNFYSTADELKKLVDLKNNGILTEEEFNQQKQKLLS